MTHYILGIATGIVLTVTAISLFMLTYGRHATLNDHRVQDELGLDWHATEGGRKFIG